MKPGSRFTESITAGRPLDALALTNADYWDSYWAELGLPVEIRKSDSLYQGAITDVFDRYFPTESGLSALEIGGAPGQYLVYLQRQFGYTVHVLDSSEVGCELTRTNFEMLGVQGSVVHADMFAGDLPSKEFDIVYSLGLIEHFRDLEEVVAAHMARLRPGGTLALGCPNFHGINHFLFERLSPSVLDNVDAASAELSNWLAFEKKFRLTTRFKGYVGGFEPGIFWRLEERTLPKRALARLLGIAARVLGHPSTRPLRRLNSRLWSGYALAVYEAPRG